MDADERALRDATIPFACAPEVAPVLSTVGRTEDVRFSPDGALLALPEFNDLRLHVFALRYEMPDKAGVTAIRLERGITITSKSFRMPHGVEFLDANHLAVANRGGALEIYRIPPIAPGHAQKLLRPYLTLRGGRRSRIATPGSLAALDEGAGRWRFFVCNNYSDTVTAHSVTLDRLSRIAPLSAWRSRHETILAGPPLAVPDGVAVSPDGRWVAVSSHATGSVMLRDLHRPGATPVAELGGIVCPHGLRFDDNGAWLHVADAGSPYLHSFRRKGEEWCSVERPDRRVRIIDRVTFERGNYNPLEGGIKGLDIDAEHGVLALACEEQPLTFCDLGAVQRLPEPGPDTANEIVTRAAARDAALRELDERRARKQRRRAQQRRDRRRRLLRPGGAA